jgi:prevent-host-death family protein
VNFEELKNLIEKEEGKIIIVEKGEPVAVLISYKDYKKGREGGNLAGFASAFSQRMESNSYFPREMPEELKKEELKIEDLPV